MPSPVSDDSILPAPPPWKLEGTVYTFLTYTSSKAAGCLKLNKAFMYSPLEADSSFASGKFLGGIGMVQVIRYTDTPVGPYDELVVVPGSFGYRRQTASGNRKIMKEEKNQRATRVYVSQKQTCWNGRKNWSIPKHLARFSFKTLPGNGISIAVFPHDESISESRSGSWPIFTAIYRPISYLPSFPISTILAKFIGVDVRLAQPPLPQGGEGAEELVGTDKWHRITPYEFSWRASLGWWDLKQGHATEEHPLLATLDDREVIESSENFWPGVGRWRIGMLMENAIIEFPEGEEWGGQES